MLCCDIFFWSNLFAYLVTWRLTPHTYLAVEVFHIYNERLSVITGGIIYPKCSGLGRWVKPDFTFLSGQKFTTSMLVRFHFLCIWSYRDMTFSTRITAGPIAMLLLRSHDLQEANCLRVQIIRNECYIHLVFYSLPSLSLIFLYLVTWMHHRNLVGIITIDKTNLWHRLSTHFCSD